MTEAEFAHKTRSHFYAAGRAGKGGIGQGTENKTTLCSKNWEIGMSKLEQDTIWFQPRSNSRVRRFFKGIIVKLLFTLHNNKNYRNS